MVGLCFLEIEYFLESLHKQRQKGFTYDFLHRVFFLSETSIFTNIDILISHTFIFLRCLAYILGSVAANSWCGHLYWLPYKIVNETLLNLCIFQSARLIHWKLPFVYSYSKMHKIYAINSVPCVLNVAMATELTNWSSCTIYSYLEKCYATMLIYPFYYS